MALKVCNGCGASYYDGDSCPECLQAGRGDVRDFHYQHEEEASSEAAPAEPGDEAEAASEPEEEDEPEVPDDEDEAPLEERTRNELSSLAASQGLDHTGTKDDLLSRLTEDGQG